MKKSLFAVACCCLFLSAAAVTVSAEEGSAAATAAASGAGYPQMMPWMMGGPGPGMGMGYHMGMGMPGMGQGGSPAMMGYGYGRGGYGGGMQQGNGYMLGPGAMMGQGMTQMGMGPGMIRNLGVMGYIPNETFQKFFDETKPLRKQLHDLMFDYAELLRQPKIDREKRVEIENKIQALRQQVYEKAPRYQFLPY